MLPRFTSTESDINSLIRGYGKGHSGCHHHNIELGLKGPETKIKVAILCVYYYLFNKLNSSDLDR